MENSQRLNTVNYFCEKAPLSMFDWVLNRSLIIKGFFLLLSIETATLNLPRIFLMWFVFYLSIWKRNLLFRCKTELCSKPVKTSPLGTKAASTKLFWFLYFKLRIFSHVERLFPLSTMIRKCNWERYILYIFINIIYVLYTLYT